MTPKRLSGALVATVIGSAVSAADVSVGQYDTPYADGPGAWIWVSGETSVGDYQRFLTALPEAIALHGSTEHPIDVWFDGPGGDLDEAIKLGQLIYDLGFATLVDGGDECASACALLWLSGTTLYMVEGAKIGFHQAYEAAGAASIVGNARVGHYLAQVGLEASVVDYVMSSEPDGITWLEPRIAEAIDLPIFMLAD